MRRLLFALAFGLGCVSAHAQDAPNPATNSCSAAQSFFQRQATIQNIAAFNAQVYPTQAQLFGQKGDLAKYISTVTTLLCKLQRDGTYNHLDVLYVFHAPSVALAAENLVTTAAGIAQGTNFTMTLTGNSWYTRNSGLANDSIYTGTSFWNTNANVSTLTHFGLSTKAGGSAGECIISGRQGVGNNAGPWGSSKTSATISFFFHTPWTSGNQLQYAVNSAGVSTTIGSITNNGPTGDWSFFRSNSTQSSAYKAGSLIATSSATETTALPSQTVYLGGSNTNNAYASKDGTDNLGYFWIGDGGVVPATIYSDLHAAAVSFLWPQC